MKPPSLFQVCEPRDDVLKGKLDEEEFAAKLSEVVHAPEEAPSIYRDPRFFYQKTYPTKGLKTLLNNLAGRILVSEGVLSGESFNSILCLDTTFGGGKTHDLIAVYHLANRPNRIENLERFFKDEKIASKYIDLVENGFQTNIAAIIGSDLDAKSAKSSKKADHPDTKTLWGEIAYQLFGVEGYEELESYDVDKQAPGTNALKGLFERSDNPALILIDEIAEYLESAASERVGESTLSRQTLSFLLNLFEAAASSENITIVYSVSDTAFSDKAEEVRKLTDDLENIAQRQREVITPTGPTEVGAVLRHRLFKTVQDGAAEEVAKAYFQHYTSSSANFPARVKKPEFKQELEREYPFHPTVIRTLSEKVDTIPKFQKTRDALRLMARAIHGLWEDEPNEYTRHLLRVYDLTPADRKIKGQLDATLFERVDLSGAVKADIYHPDESSHAQEEDQRWISKGIPPLGSHISITTLWNSLAVGEKAVGVTRAELNEAVGHLGIPYEHYVDALANLTGENELSAASWYLYDEDRLKFKGEANHYRIIAQTQDNIPDAQAKELIERTLKKVVGDGPLNVQFFPEDPADVPDNSEVPNLCVMHFDTVTIGSPESSDIEEAPGTIKELYEKTASSHGGKTEARSYKNYVLFIVPDYKQVEGAIEEAKKLEAIKELLKDSQRSADLSEEQIDELKEIRQNVAGLLGQGVRNSYRHLFYVEEGALLTRVPISSVDGNGDARLHDGVLTTLEGIDRVVKAKDSGKHHLWVERKLWQKGKEKMSTGKLAKQFARKPGLPYLLDPEPLRKTVAKAVTEADYGYWDGEENIAYTTDDDLNYLDVKIGGSYELYQTVDALKKEHPDAIEEEDEKKKVSEEEEAKRGKTKGRYQRRKVGTHGGGEIRETPTQRWRKKTDMVAATRALTEVRDDAKAATDEGTPGVKKLRIEVGGDKPFKHGEFLSKRPALKEYASIGKARVEYQATANLEGETASLLMQFEGPLTALRSINDNIESFSQGDGERQWRVVLELDLAKSTPIEEGDLLSNLAGDLENTGIRIQVDAEGPSSIVVSE